MAHQPQQRTRIHSELSPDSEPEPSRAVNTDSHQQPTSRVPSVSDFPSASHFMLHRGGGHPGIWQNPYESFGDPDDNVSMETWPSRRTTSNMTGLEYFHDPPFLPYMVPPWSHLAQYSGPNVTENRSQRDKNAHQVMMGLREDQFGQILEATSPSKKHRDLPHGLPAQRSAQDSRQPNAQSHRPPKMGALSVPVRPSSAAVARTTSYPDLNAALRSSSKRPSFDQARFNPGGSGKTNSQSKHHNSQKENRDASQPRIPTPHPFAHHVAAPNPFMLDIQGWNSDVSMRDGSLDFSSLSRFERDPTNTGSKVSSAHAPSAVGSVKSRKEGLAHGNDDLPDVDIRHDQSLFPTLGGSSASKAKLSADDPDRTPRTKPNGPFVNVPRDVEVIDVDAIDPSLVAETTADLAKLSPFKPSHKSGMSSMSSTGRLERQLYSALGEELGSFEQHMDTTGMGPELAQALSGTATHSDLSGSTMLDPMVGEFESVVKRKRQGTLGGERDKSPVKKKEKARQSMVEDDDIPADMP